MPRSLRTNMYGANGGKAQGNKFKVSIVDSASSISVPGAGKKTFNVNFDGGVIEGAGDGSGSLTLSLRVLDYCDGEGETKKIIVLASEPFSPED